MFKLLNLIEANVHLFEVDNKQLLAQVLAHRKVFEVDNHNLIKNVKTWRDQLYAHTDRSYFLDKDRPKLGENAPMLYSELLTLLQIAAQTINHYYKVLDKSIIILDHPEITRDADTLFEILSLYNEARSKC